VPQNLPEWFIKKAQAVTAKRAKTVIAHILKHGHITTEELKAHTGMTIPRARHVTYGSKGYRSKPSA